MTSHFKRKAFRPVTPTEMNQIFRYVASLGGAFYFREFVKELDESLKYNCYIVDGLRFLKATCRYKGKVATYVCDKTLGTKEGAKKGCSMGLMAYYSLLKFVKKEDIHPIVKEEDFTDDGKNLLPFSTSPFIWWSQEYNHTENFAYDYDMNSAYSTAMLGDMPDTSKVTSVDITSFNMGITKEDEIGFDANGNLTEVGEIALYRFKKIPSPFKKFVEYYYKLKHDAKTKAERTRAKDVLNLSVGYLQRVNPFIRATIVSRANKTIQSLMDENTIYCNTDSIVSLTERKDLKIGDDIGEWKLENKGIFRYVSANYQWNGELPKYRGVPKEWFGENYNILTDELPPNRNKYKLDPLAVKLVKNDDYDIIIKNIKGGKENVTNLQ